MYTQNTYASSSPQQVSSNFTLQLQQRYYVVPSWLEVDDLHNVGREAARDSGLLLVPGDLEDVALALEAADVHALVDVPDVELSRQAAAGQVVPGGAEGDGVDRVGMALEGADVVT